FPVATLAMQRRAIARDDVDRDLVGKRESFARTRSVLSSPLIVRDEVTGVITFQRHRTEPFTSAQQDFARKIGSSLSLALENARLFEEQSERTALADALNTIDAEINETLDFDTALELSLPTAAIVLAADAAVVMRVEGDDWVLASALNLEPLRIGARKKAVDVRASMLAVSTRQVVAIQDTQTDERANPEIARTLGIRAMLVAPLALGDEELGVVAFIKKAQPWNWTQPQIDFAGALGSHLSLALQNSRLFEEECERGRLNLELTEIDALIHSSKDFEGVLDKALALGTKAVSGDMGSLSLHESGRWIARYEYGFGADLLGYSFLNEDADYLETMRQEREPIVFEYSPDAPDVIEWNGIRVEFSTNVVIPLVVRDELMGLMIVNRLQPGTEFARADVDFLRRLGASVSLALENLRLLEEEQRSAALAAALNRVNELLLSTLDVEEMLERMVAEASGTVGASKAALARFENDEWRITSTHGYPPEFLGSRLTRQQATAFSEAARTREPVVIADATSDARISPEMSEKYGLRSYVLFPLLIGADLLGVLVFGYEAPGGFGEIEVGFAGRLASAITLALERARLYQTERHIAHTLQDTLLVMPTHIRGIDFAHTYRSATDATRVGGDFIDAFQISPRRIAISLGDVAGKGLPAAAVTAMVRTTMRAHAVDGLPPALVAEKTNNLLRLFTATETFVTAFFGVLDTRTGRLCYVSAGHPPALLFREGGDVRPLQTSSPVLGAFSDVHYREGECVLEHGDCLLAYTDGVIEARGESGMFGEERLWQILAGMGGAAPDAVVNRVFSAVEEHTHGAFHDDVAILAVSRDRGVTGDAGNVQQRLAL
ncbi:MAG TPA: SpoIIE family protein phosphatase, partial [Coriobacteriia bacterium]|nr:SpoIIE family protein phosphatase [Coriobacteriia bacterium]